MKLLQRVMSTEPEKSLALPPFWAVSTSARKPERDTAAPTFANAMAGAIEALRGQIGTVPQLLLAFGKMLRVTQTVDENLRVPLRSAGRHHQRPRAQQAPLRDPAVRARAQEDAGRRRRLHAQ